MPRHADLRSPRRHPGRAAAVQRRSLDRREELPQPPARRGGDRRASPPSPSMRIRPRSRPAPSTSSGACSTIAQDEIGGRLPIVNGVWADGSLEAARIARMAAEGGASALLVFPPAPVHAQPVARDGARAFQAHRRRDRPADHRVPVSAGDRPGLSARHAAADVRAGARPSAPSRTGRQRARSTRCTSARCRACRGR